MHCMFTAYAEPRAFERRHEVVKVGGAAGEIVHGGKADLLIGQELLGLRIPFGDHPLKLERYRED